MLPVRKQLVGDPVVCAKYLAWATGKARALRKVVQYGSQKFPFDDALVDVHVSGNDLMVRIIELCPMPYVESGAVDVSHWSKFYMDKVDTSKVYKCGLTGISKDPLLGTVKLPAADPYTSKIYALPIPPTPLPITPPPDPRNCMSELTFEVDQGCMQCAMYPDQCELRNKKMALRYLNASKATGKMRVFLQAMTGSGMMNRLTLEKDNYDYNVTRVYLDTYLRIDPNNYIVRDGRGEYWLMNGESAYWMRFSPCADSVKAELHSHGGGGMTRKRESELEAHLFAQLIVEPPSDEELALWGETGIVPSPPGFYPCMFPIPEGSTLDWGWHFQYQGNKAIQVRHIQTDGFYNAILEYEAQVNVLTCNTSPNDPVDGLPRPPTLTVAITERAKWALVTGYAFIWSVNHASNTQNTAPPNTKWKSGAYDAPMYAFYDSSDIPLYVRWKRAPTPVAAPSVLVDERDSCMYGTVLQTGATSSYSYGFYTTGYSSVSAYNVAQNFTRTVASKSGGGGSLTSYIGDLTYYFGDCSGTPAGWWPTPPATRAYGVSITSYLGTNVSYILAGTQFDGPTPILVFPVDNPDAVYIGLEQRDILNGIDQTVNYNNCAQRETLSGGGVDYTRNLGNSVSADSADSGPGVITHDYQTRHVHLVTPFHSVSVADETFTSNTSGSVTTVSGGGNWTRMFHPFPDGDPYTERHYRVWESVNGLLKYDIDINYKSKVLGEVMPADKDTYFVGYA